MSLNSNFNKAPVIQVAERGNDFFAGWDNIYEEIRNKITRINKEKIQIVIECYQGVNHNEILNSLIDYLGPDYIVLSSDSFHTEEKIKALTYPDVTDDRVFGFMTRLSMIDFLDKEKLSQTKKNIENFQKGTILIYGHGASLIVSNPDILIYADMARWEIQQRMRRNEINNLGICNQDEHPELQYKRGFFVDWRVCDRLKKKLLSCINYFLDTNIRDHPKMVTAKAVFAGLEEAIHRPFSLVPYFDQGPWGGQWMKEICDLNAEVGNYAWCFNCVPEENSLFLGFGEELFEIPAINLVFYKPAELLGNSVHARFGDEFPIRFDFLDTMDGGNLSLQVHPVTTYIQEKFGVHYTQDESYYLLDARNDASVFLGLKENISSEELKHELFNSLNGNKFFNAEKYVENWPAKKHDHFLIPGGTIHCSGKNCLVLEISSTPYIFTFKLWDWGRKGLDGNPRPINIEHGINVIQWNRTKDWIQNQLINKIEKINEGDGWVEEKTGLHELEFIETRRHWFTKKVLHNTWGVVNVLNLVEGKEVLVESPEDAFQPYVVHYAETFIVPAAVSEYSIRPHGESEGQKCATIKAFVRTNA